MIMAAAKDNTVLDDVIKWSLAPGLQILVIIVLAIIAQWLLTSLVRRAVRHAIDRGCEDATHQ